MGEECSDMTLFAHSPQSRPRWLDREGAENGRGQLGYIDQLITILAIAGDGGESWFE